MCFLFDTAPAGHFGPTHPSQLIPCRPRGNPSLFHYYCSDGSNKCNILPNFTACHMTTVCMLMDLALNTITYLRLVWLHHQRKKRHGPGSRGWESTSVTLASGDVLTQRTSHARLRTEILMAGPSIKMCLCGTMSYLMRAPSSNILFVSRTTVECLMLFPSTMDFFKSFSWLYFVSPACVTRHEITPG